MLLLGGTIALYVTFSLPAMQRWLGRTLSVALTEGLGSRVAIQSVNASILWRPVLDGVMVFDQQGDTLMTVSRIAARTSLMSLLAGRYSFAHVQLYRPDIRLSQDSVGTLNCQYIIDMLNSGGGGDGGTDVSINTILLRRGTLAFVRDTSYLRVTDIAATVHGIGAHDKIFAAELHDMHFTVDSLTFGDMFTKDLALNDMHGSVRVSPDGVVISDACLSLPDARFAFGHLSWTKDFRLWTLADARAHVDIRQLHGIAQDIQDIDATFSASGTNEKANISRLHITSKDIAADVRGRVYFAPLAVELENLTVDVERGQLSGAPLNVEMSGYYSKERAQMEAQITAPQLFATAKATMRDNDYWRAELRTHDAAPSALLSRFRQTNRMAGMFGDSMRVTVDLKADGRLPHRSWHVEGNIGCNSRPLAFNARGYASHSLASGIDLAVRSDVSRVRPSSFGADGRLSTYMYAAKIQAELQCPSWNVGNGDLRDVLYQTTGRIIVPEACALDDTLFAKPLVHDLLVDIVSTPDDDRRVSVYSDILLAHALIRQPDKDGCRAVSLTSQMWDASTINFLANTDISICDTLTLTLLHDTVTRMSLHVDSIYVGKECLSTIAVMVQKGRTGSTATASFKRWMKNSVASIDANASMAGDTTAMASLIWTLADLDGHADPDNHGSLHADIRMGDTILIHALPGAVALNGTDWQVKPGVIALLPGGALTIDSFAIEAGERHLRLQGRMSSDPADTLRAVLRDVNLGYIFNLVNFDDVNLDGDATGLLSATGLTSSPMASGRLFVRDFSFNRAVLGDMQVLASWSTEQRQLDIDAHITGPGVPSHAILSTSIPVDTYITGRVNPGKSNPRSGLDLDVRTKGFNLGFLNEYTGGVFDNVAGSVSGRVRIHGPFNAIDLDGSVLIDHCVTHVPSLGVDYQLFGDSVRVSSGLFAFDNVSLYDKQARINGIEHRAIVNGRLTHRHFKRWRYDFSAATNNILAYDTKDFGEDSFYGTAYVTGDVRLTGGPDQLNVEVTGNTEAGSLFVYNSTTPDAITSSDFITYVDARQKADDTSSAVHVAPDYAPVSDMRLNFNVNVTPETTLRVLMDTRSGDYIELHGTMPLQASYYNKGAFQMYGTYRVQRGRYRMTLQDFIRKDFTFREGGTIAFAGSPMQATLGLQAVYTVPGVSLNDLSAGNAFSSSRVRVNCLMNLTGDVSAPRVSFDFDLPNATQDEQAMVRSLVSTDEERNLQAIYLLGLGCFYVQDDVADNAQDRGGMAVNSFLSSTLSSQINSILGDVMGNTHWTFGTNISTGQAGWNEVQAEGSLSGRLFNDRLLLNGTFGYRDGGTTNQNGFVGDFDIQWILTRNSTISLKTYSQTSDRYLTKSALTTQGVGLILKKDFNTLGDLFNIRPAKNHLAR